MNCERIMSDLRKIPGIGSEMEKDLIKLGYSTVDSLIGANPEEMYDRICELSGCIVDKCVLYVFRCAVYFAENEHHEPEKLKWWNWKDK